eukprot:5545232-Prymnesium_polylepis.2
MGMCASVAGGVWRTVVSELVKETRPVSEFTSNAMSMLTGTLQTVPRMAKLKSRVAVSRCVLGVSCSAHIVYHSSQLQSHRVLIGRMLTQVAGDPLAVTRKGMEKWSLFSEHDTRGGAQSKSPDRGTHIVARCTAGRLRPVSVLCRESALSLTRTCSQARDMCGLDARCERTSGHCVITEPSPQPSPPVSYTHLTLPTICSV